MGKKGKIKAECVWYMLLHGGGWNTMAKTPGEQGRGKKDALDEEARASDVTCDATD